MRLAGRKSPTTPFVLAFLVALVATASASAAPPTPLWAMSALTNSTAAPGETYSLLVSATNRGDDISASSAHPVTFTGELPAGVSASFPNPPVDSNFHPFSCPGFSPGDTSFTCIDEGGSYPHRELAAFKLKVDVAPDAPLGQAITATFEVKGGAESEPSAATASLVTVATEPPPFELRNFDAQFFADASASPYSQAGGHPDSAVYSHEVTTSLEDFPAKGLGWPIEPIKELGSELPPGSVGVPTAVPTCTVEQLIGVGNAEASDCPPAAQVGLDLPIANVFGIAPAYGPFPVFNMVAPERVAARLAFKVAGILIFLDARVRASSDYGLTVVAPSIPEGLPLAGNVLTLWGNPSSPAHFGDRACPEQTMPVFGGPNCSSGIEEVAFLREPTSCPPAGVGLPFTGIAESWRGSSGSRAISTHVPRGFPFQQADWGSELGTTDCDAVPFNPALSVTPTSPAADSPTGLDVEISVPQGGLVDPDAMAQSDVRRVALTLPQGMSINPAAATGQGGCTPAQVGLTTPLGETPIHFDEEAAQCPSSSKIGTAELETPLLEKPLKGALYLGAQGDNPFKSLLSIYVVLEDPERGVIVKLPGRITADPETGRLETVFDENPQQPFAHFKVHLFSGPRASLRTPPTCGTFAARSILTPWSGGDSVNVDAGFEITEGPHGGRCPTGQFQPSLHAGTQNPLAGAFSTFSLRVVREDGEKELGGLSAALPPGLIGYIKGIPYCSDAALATVSSELGTGKVQEALPSCPAESQLGKVTVGAGAGVTPFFSEAGRAYLAGPYKGAPLSLAVITPAVAGPFDLGSVLVRNALTIDPETAQVTAVSDPLPSILHGIPLDLRDVRVQLDRSNFTINPTSCEPMQVTSTITAVDGASASPSERFQAGGCERLPFKPKTTIFLKGKAHRGGNPALKVVVLAGAANDANIAHAQTTLPSSEFIASEHLNDVCSRVQFSAGGGGGQQCPTNSIYGHARAYTPVIEEPFEGNVYLRSNPERELPDIVAALHGRGIESDLVGHIDSVNGGIRASFETVPDVFVSKFVLEMQGGKKSLLENKTNICRGKHRATVRYVAHNGKTHDTRPVVKASCAHSKRHRRKRGR